MYVKFVSPSLLSNPVKTEKKYYSLFRKYTKFIIHREKYLALYITYIIK